MIVEQLATVEVYSASGCRHLGHILIQIRDSCREALDCLALRVRLGLLAWSVLGEKSMLLFGSDRRRDDQSFGDTEWLLCRDWEAESVPIELTGSNLVRVLLYALS